MIKNLGLLVLQFGHDFFDLLDLFPFFFIYLLFIVFSLPTVVLAFLYLLSVEFVLLALLELFYGLVRKFRRVVAMPCKGLVDFNFWMVDPQAYPEVLISVIREGSAEQCC